MELFLAVIIVCLSAGGLALGLMLGGRAPRTACDGLACLPESRCAGCPRRREAGHD
jgi:hypothetical protein